jgi:hypothetical protein
MTNNPKGEFQMATKLIDQIRRLDDLAAGETAAPEKGLDYTVAPCYGDKSQPEKVQFLIRRGDHLYAMTTQWNERCINGTRDDGVELYAITATPNRKHYTRRFGPR